MNKVKSVYSPSENAIYNAALYESYIKGGHGRRMVLKSAMRMLSDLMGEISQQEKCWEWFQGPLHGLMSRRFHQNSKYQMQKT